MQRSLDRLIRGIIITGTLLIPSYGPGFIVHANQQKIAQQQEYSDKIDYQQGIKLYNNAVKEEKRVARLIRRALVGDAPRKYILLANTFQELNANNTIDRIIEEALKARNRFETLVNNYPDSEYADDCLFMVGESSLLIARLFTDVYGVTAGSRIQSGIEAKEKLARFKLDEIGIEGQGLLYTYNCDAYRKLLETYPESESADNAQFRLDDASMGSRYEGYEGDIRREAEDSLKVWLPFMEKYPDCELMDQVLLRTAIAYHTLAGYDGILGGYSPTRYDIQGIINRGRRSGSIRDEKGEMQEIVFDQMSFTDEDYLGKALRAYQQIADNYPGSESAAVAQYYTGVLHELGYKDTESAIEAHQGVIESYPDALKFDEDALLVKLAGERIKRLK